MQSDRRFRLLVGLLVVGIILISLTAGVSYLDSEQQSSTYDVAAENLEDPATVTRELSARAGFDVRWPASVPRHLQLGRARVVAAFDPVEATYPDDEWWTELHWGLPEGAASPEDHPWFEAILTQGRDLPVPEHAEEMTLPGSGIAAHVTSTEDQVYESATIWVSDDGMDFALRVQSIRSLPDEDVGHLLVELLEQ